MQGENAVHEHDVPEEQKHEVDQPHGSQCRVAPGQDPLVGVLSVVFPHQDHAHAVPQQGGEHGQAPNVDEHGAEHDGDFVPEGIVHHYANVGAHHGVVNVGCPHGHGVGDRNGQQHDAPRHIRRQDSMSRHPYSFTAGLTTPHAGGPPS